ncbi:hypothetical protein BJF93_14265 [Xaviernesmea oryzae]|uniref:DUF2336 domain-containing protein n=1 Tax=Xaviernesmea oryzae TaxID=464029 RepID=A0A1Q9ARD1_9HYPH|nr:DUF2336 domain-containing protein [Xaviernesmea oryzae]OLP57987.1 hypothetical protein BJF93_14265 [Xaviernesmea oryzae]SEL27693.1 Uncharacterized conserved protein, DUF2336 family [Xaviernesmea oryzae]
MSDRFRELEKTQGSRVKDVVLLATVTSFEALRQPRKADLRQFEELFVPLFAASSDEARRQAASALSRCHHVPASVAYQIGSAPIAIAAPFLAGSPAIDETMLIALARSQSIDHAEAIARRDDLSPALIEALVERRQLAQGGLDAAAGRLIEMPAIPAHAQPPAERDERLRQDLKAMMRRTPSQPEPQMPSLPAVDPSHGALLVRFARLGEVNMLASCLAAVLGADLSLGERLVLDVSGQQLATVLVALKLPISDRLTILSYLYPYLAEIIDGRSRAELMLDALDEAACAARVASWLDTAGKSERTPQAISYLAANREKDARRPGLHAAPSRPALPARARLAPGKG